MEKPSLPVETRNWSFGISPLASNSGRLSRCRKTAFGALAFSPDGDLLASAGNNLEVSIWKNGQHDRIFKTSGNSASKTGDLELMPAGVSFNSEGTMLATSTQGHSVTLWRCQRLAANSPGALRRYSGCIKRCLQAGRQSPGFRQCGRRYSPLGRGDSRIDRNSWHAYQRTSTQSLLSREKESWLLSAKMIPSFYGMWISRTGSVAHVGSRIGISRQKNGIHTLEPVPTGKPVRIVERRG